MIEPAVGMKRPQGLNLKQAAAQLGVHYMTAYRYIRTGRLAARKVNSGWVIDQVELQRFAGDPKNIELEGHGSSSGDQWLERLRSTLVIGDEAAAWRVIEQALSAGHSPTQCYLDLIVGALNEISDRSQQPRQPVASEYLATATATRLVARLGARFRRPGRSRGTIVFGAPRGEHHVLAISVVADLVRLGGFTCLELGADVPAEAFAGAARDAYRLVAVGIGVTTATNLAVVKATIDAVHAVDAGVPVVLGGQAAGDPLVAASIGANAWATDGLHAIEVFNDLAVKRKVLWLELDRAMEAS
ncbi:MAG: cobalamin-dependent protein [Acidimicrobiales bacterium]|jgi:methanogenic corrinoid protein MtbC1